MKKRLKFLSSFILVTVLIFASSISSYASEARLLNTTTGFKPRTLTICPIVTTAAGEELYLTQLQQSVNRLGSATDSNYVTFKGPGYDYLDQVKAAVILNEGTLSGWHISLTGYVNGTNSEDPAHPDMAQSLSFSWAEEPVTTVTVSTGKTIKIDLDYMLPEGAETNVYNIKVAGVLNYYAYEYNGYNFAKPSSRSWSISASMMPLRR